MAIQLSAAVRNARLDSIETTIGTAAKIELRTGSMPANCAAATTGTLIASATLASDWAAAASGGSKSFSNTPINMTAVAASAAGPYYYRIYDNAGTTCHMQGTAAASGGDATLNNENIANGQTVTITGWSITDGNA